MVMQAPSLNRRDELLYRHAEQTSHLDLGEVPRLVARQYVAVVSRSYFDRSHVAASFPWCAYSRW